MFANFSVKLETKSCDDQIIEISRYSQLLSINNFKHMENKTEYDNFNIVVVLS